MLEIYAIMDTKAGAFMNPFYPRSLGEAVRSFSNEANNPESPLGKYPEDFNLFHLGKFNQVTGEISLEPSPKSIGTAANFKKPV